ncbi:MAG: hypothetical protein NTY99_01555 [DPANN group archaeon]|nr:hypothetical protein [DPANN group archaeon]
MATTQLQTLSTLKTQVGRPINSPAVRESKAEKETSKLEQDIDYISPLVSLYDALPEGEGKDAVREIILTINPDKELDLEHVVSDFTAALASADSGTAQAAHYSIKHLLGLYEQGTLKTYGKEPVISEMHYATKRNGG